MKMNSPSASKMEATGTRAASHRRLAGTRDRRHGRRRRRPAAAAAASHSPCLPETNTRRVNEIPRDTWPRALRKALGLVLAVSLALGECRQLAASPAHPQPFSPYAFNPQQQRLSSGALLATQQRAEPSATTNQRCRIGAPLQWRPHLDAASKSYLAPAVALATLKDFRLEPLQLGGGGGGPQAGSSLRADNQALQQQQQARQFHAQNVNNAGVLIEATFQINAVLKRTRTMDLRQSQQVKLRYKVSASLSTTSDMIALASSEQQQQANYSTTTSQAVAQRARRLNGHKSAPADEQACALELTEGELARRGNQLLRPGQDYVLFLDQLVNLRQNSAARLQPAATSGARHNTYPNQAAHLQAAGAETFWTAEISWHPFALHEMLVNQTSRALHRLFCKDCVRAPSVQLVNATTISSKIAGEPGVSPNARQRIKLDCRVSGNPAPWVEWFRNGKRLRNRSRGVRVQTSPVKRRPLERLSRLELDLETGRNESGLYECRAMSVAAREPAVGTYTLLVLPERQFALVPMQPLAGGGGGELIANTTRAPQSGGQPANETGETATETTPISSSAESAAGGAGEKAPGGAVQIVAGQQQQQQPASETNKQVPSSAGQPPATRATSSSSSSNNNSKTPTAADPQRASPPASPTSAPQAGSHAASTKSGARAVVVGQPCQREAHDNYCLNKGTCVLIGHIEEYFCNCAEGYHGHRCEYKSLGHQQATR